MIFTLAAATGWSRDYIRYHLPLSEARQYLHCHLMSNPTVWVVDQAGYQPPADAPRDLASEEVFDLEL